MSRGVLMFAHNNTEIDYFKIALVNALMVRENLKVPVTVVTDNDTLEWARKTYDNDLIDLAFENIIASDRDYTFDRTNVRIYRDTQSKSEKLPFHNCNHWQAYDLSPYDETLFIDADYLIMSDALSACWGSVHDFMINDNVQEAMFDRTTVNTFIDPYSIRLYWATVIYFRKSEVAEKAFDIARHVFENYTYYKDLYSFSNGMFRNDWAFSVAIHQLNGNTDRTTVPRLPIVSLLKTFDIDDIVSVNAINNITFLMQKSNAREEFLLTKVKDTDVHVMNKWALLRQADELIRLYK